MKKNPLKKLIMELKVIIMISALSILNAFATNSFLKAADSDSEIQQTIITGTVTETSTGEPMPGVNIQVKGTNIGVITDGRGAYSLSVTESDATLVFSFIGYVIQEISLNGRKVLDVALVSDLKTLEEVVVVGYGTQKKVNLTGAVSSVNSDFISSRPLTNSTQSLQGINGIYVNQAGGQPGADNATIRIRGIGTLNNNNPLVLVDGVEYNLKDINPNDIENISVLKDAASASIYGNRSANGVILVTTKKGKSGQLKTEFGSYFGIQQATFVPDMVTNSVDFLIARNQAAINDGQPKPYSDAQIDEYRNGTDPDTYPNTDWYDIMLSAAPIQDHNLRLSGGNDKVSFSLSLEYLNQEGVVMGTNAKKYNLNSNVVFKKSEKLEFGAIINGSFWDSNDWGVSGSTNTSMMGNIARALPIHPNILADGRYGDTWLVTPGHNLFRHPVATAKETEKNLKTQQAMINLFTEYIFPLEIKYKINFAITKFDAYENRFLPVINLFVPKTNVTKILRIDPGTGVHSSRRDNNNNLNSSFFQTLNWTKKIAEQHDVNLLLGFSRETFYSSNFFAYIEGFLGNELTELDAGTINKNVGGTSSESRLMSYFGRANYGFSDKYLLEFNFRYDGSSRFARKNRWGFFPSFSAGWRIDQEPFMQNLEAFSNLKLRISWGQLGNQNINLYSYLSNINISQGTSFNNSVVAGSAITSLSDPDISWETTSIKNLGLDIGLWDNKLEIYIDVFDKITTDILARINIPGEVGDLNGPITNLYGMSNKGIEMNFSYRNSIGDLTYRIGTNASFVKNNVDYMRGDEQYKTSNYGNISIIKEGYSVDSWYLYEAIGIFKTDEEVKNHAFQHPSTAPGDLIYLDRDNNDTIDVRDMSIKGRSVPNFMYSFNLDFDYKEFDISAFFQGVQGIDIYPVHNVSFPLFNGAGITKEQLADSWTPQNPNAKFPRLFEPERGTQINAQNSTFWLKDASYLRLKNLQIGYSIPSELLSKINVSNLRLYVNAQNALTLSKYKLTDPEMDVQRKTIFDYPALKMFTIGCNVVF